MGIFTLNIYLRISGYRTNYPIGYPGNQLPGCGSPKHNTRLNTEYSWTVCQIHPCSRKYRAQTTVGTRNFN